MKIFGIGLGKTGTTSLSAALNILGYRSCHFPLGILTSQNHEFKIDSNFVAQYDAFADLPIACLYKDLDVRYPDSKFILTVRDIPTWLKSSERHYASVYRGLTRPDWWCEARQGTWEEGDDKMKRVVSDLFGTILFDHSKYEEGYKRHFDGVINFFRKREKDLLIINVCSGEGWDKLCPFLNKPPVNSQFPQENVRS